VAVKSILPSLPKHLYHWTSSTQLQSILDSGLKPALSRARGGHNRNKAVIFLQDEAEVDFAGTYFNLPPEPVRLTIDTSQLQAEWSADLAAWSDWPGDPEEGLIGTLEAPSPLDTLYYTGCICYHGSIPRSAILEAIAIPLPEHLINL
jgi:hypothetical protein